MRCCARRLLFKLPRPFFRPSVQGIVLPARARDPGLVREQGQPLSGGPAAALKVRRRLLLSAPNRSERLRLGHFAFFFCSMQRRPTEGGAAKKMLRVFQNIELEVPFSGEGGKNDKIGDLGDGRC